MRNSFINFCAESDMDVLENLAYVQLAIFLGVSYSTDMKRFNCAEVLRAR